MKIQWSGRPKRKLGAGDVIGNDPDQPEQHKAKHHWLKPNWIERLARITLILGRLCWLFVWEIVEFRHVVNSTTRLYTNDQDSRSR